MPTPQRKEQTFQVFSSDNTSTTLTLPSGVLQGSILSPLFNIYLRPLMDVIKESGLTLFSYADVSQIIFSLSKAHSKDSSPLRQGLANVALWMNKNALKLNGDKNPSFDPG